MTAADLRVVDPAGSFQADLTDYLPDWSELSVSVDRQGTGTLPFTYPKNGAGRATFIASGVVALLVDGVEPKNCRFVRDTQDGNRIGVGRLKDGFSLVSLIQALDHAEFRSPDLVLQTRSWTNATAGTVLLDALNPAVARGTCAWWGYRGVTFTATADSNGNAWPANVNVSHEYGQSVLTIWAWLRDNGYAEFGTNQGKLEAFIPELRGTNRTTGVNSVELWAGRDLLDAPEQIQFTDYLTDITLIGDGSTDNSVIYETRSAATRPFGRYEKSYRINGVTDRPTLRAIGDKILGAFSTPRNSRTYAVAKGSTRSKTPLLAYDIADTIGVNTSGTWDDEKIKIISGKWDSRNAGSWMITVNDWLDDRDARIDKMLRQYGGA